MLMSSVWKILMPAGPARPFIAEPRRRRNRDPFRTRAGPGNLPRNSARNNGCIIALIMADDYTRRHTAITKRQPVTINNNVAWVGCGDVPGYGTVAAETGRDEELGRRDV
ncbi:MAG: hypothetical protein VW405_15000, partial [Rhodospirillaceae bacterium]